MSYCKRLLAGVLVTAALLPYCLAEETAPPILPSPETPDTATTQAPSETTMLEGWQSLLLPDSDETASPSSEQAGDDTEDTAAMTPDSAQQFEPASADETPAEASSQAEEAPAVADYDASAQAAEQTRVSTSTLTLYYNSIEGMVRESNPTVRVNQLTMQTLSATDPSQAITALTLSDTELAALQIALQTALQAMTNLQGSSPSGGPTSDEMIYAGSLAVDLTATMALVQMTRATLSSQIASATSSADSVEQTKKQLTYVEDQLCMGAQTLYISLCSVDSQLNDLKRSRTALERTLTALKKRYALGQISELTYQQTLTQATTLDNSILSLQLSIDNLKGDLSLMLGYGAYTSIAMTGLPAVPALTIHTDGDLSAAQSASFDISSKQAAYDAALSTYQASGTTADSYALQSAEISLRAAKQQLMLSMKKLSGAVSDKRRVFSAAQQSQKIAQRVYSAEARKHELGMISDNALADALDTLDSVKSETLRARIELFSAITQYQWAKRGIIAAS